MKKALLIILSIIPILAKAQWTTSGNNIYYNNGNIGVGTTNPDAKIHIQGTPWTGIKIQDITTSGGRGIENSYLDGNNDGWRMYFGGHYNGQPLRFAPVSNGVQGPNTLSLLDNGNVGIGTTNPEVKLHLSGALALRSGTVSNSSTGDILGINRLVFGDLNAHYVNYGRIWSSGSQLYIQGGLNGISINNTSNVSSIKVLNTGNVGIGNTNPTEKLVVDGKILAEEVKVQNVPASDYVFEPDYNLKPIEEVETFIKENKHLPDIPSAEEFKENGVGLGEMDDMLLRKVEELTLYVIGLQKELMELKNENKEIKSLNIELIDRIEKLDN
ncbi:MAG: hypothetical protein MI975_08270 [Cytophagales bacterium]|nr:hypothetical protein [Cytophagales bacterium]